MVESAPPRVRLWGTICGLLVFGLTLPLWATQYKFTTIYCQIALAEFPEVTLVALEFGGILWIPAAAGFLFGVILARKGQRARAAALFFWMTITIVIVQVLLFLALGYPLTKVQSV